MYDFIFILQETAARDGLMKMKTVYEANPALGDPMSIQVISLTLIPLLYAFALYFFLYRVN